MTWYQIAMMCGVPTLCVTILLGLVKWIVAQIKVIREEDQSVKLGVQALLRSQMITDYNHYSRKGYAPIYAKENFENCWRQYHNLGLNGVMDDMRTKFMALPTETEDTK